MRWLSNIRYLIKGLRRTQPDIEPASGPGPEAGQELKIPAHLAVIMDGNGRWANKRGLPRQAGHRAGADNLTKVCRLCTKYGIKYLTVYAFSTENWSRPESEVQTLMGLFVEYIQRFDREMAQEGVRLRFSGDLAALPENMRQIMAAAEEASRQRDRLQLIIAINYGGRRELAQACQKLARSACEGRISPASFDEETLRSALYLPDVPDPDLVIRPSGEQRLSNFLLWESAYSELWFSDVLWPDFAEQHLLDALRSFTSRDRRYGGIKA
jgi:undecaprenyl diphosphate synthase